MQIADIIQMEEVMTKDGHRPPFLVALTEETFEKLSGELSDPRVILPTSDKFTEPAIPLKKSNLFNGRQCKALIRDSYIFV